MKYHFGHVDLEQMRLLGQITPAKRLNTMLAARKLAASLIRSRLRRCYPNLSPRDLNLKLVEELSRAGRARPRP